MGLNFGKQQWDSTSRCELKREGQKCSIFHFRKSIFDFCMKSTFKYKKDQLVLFQIKSSIVFLRLREIFLVFFSEQILKQENFNFRENVITVT